MTVQIASGNKELQISVLIVTFIFRITLFLVDNLFKTSSKVGVLNPQKMWMHLYLSDYVHVSYSQRNFPLHGDLIKKASHVWLKNNKDKLKGSCRETSRNKEQN